MQKEPLRILALNPGSRYIGFAAFRGPELLDWGLKAIRAKTRNKKLKATSAIFIDAVERFRPEVLAIKRMHPSRSSPCLDGLIETIEHLCRRRKIRVCRYSLAQVKDALLPKVKGNRRRVAECVATTYAALAHDFQKELANRNPYYLRMFEAVALGVVCRRTVEE